MNTYHIPFNKISFPAFCMLAFFSLFYYILDISAFHVHRLTPIILLLLIGSFLNSLLHKQVNMSVLEFASFSTALGLLYTMFLGIVSFMIAPGLAGDINTESLLMILLHASLVVFSIIVYRSELCVEIHFEHNKLSAILAMVPIIVVGATRLLYIEGVRLPILLVLFLLSLIPIFAIGVSGFPLPVAIASLAGSLLLYNSTFGLYPRPTDNIVEYNIILDILEANSWIPSITIGMNGMPGSVLILPSLSIMTGLQPATLYKYFAPIIALIIPLILFYSYINIFSKHTSFFASVWFVSIFNFFAWSSTTMKMVSSGVFVSLLVYSITTQRISNFSRRILMILSFGGVALSHYGTTYILMISIIATTTFMTVLDFASGKDIYTLSIPEINIIKRFSNISVGIFVIGALSWYIYLTSSSNLRSFATTIMSFVLWLTSSPSVGSSGTVGNQILFGDFPINLSLLRGIFFISFGLMMIGIIASLLNHHRGLFVDEFTIMSGFISLLIPLPYLLKIGQYSGGRIWLIPAYFSSVYVFKGLSWVLNNISIDKLSTNKLKISAIFFTIFILLNSGVTADVVFGENRTASIYLSEPRISNSGTVEEKEYLDRSMLNHLDVVGSKWSVQYLSHDSPVWVDQNADNSLRFAGFTRARQHHDYGTRNIYYISKRNTREIDGYIFLSKFNTDTGYLRVSGGINSDFLQKHDLQLNSRSKLYSNGGSTLYD